MARAVTREESIRSQYVRTCLVHIYNIIFNLFQCFTSTLNGMCLCLCLSLTIIIVSSDFLICCAVSEGTNDQHGCIGWKTICSIFHCLCRFHLDLTLSLKRDLPFKSHSGRAEEINETI